MSDSSKVICPACVHEFRAVPVDVQEELAALRKDAERYRRLLDRAVGRLPLSAPSLRVASINVGPQDRVAVLLDNHISVEQRSRIEAYLSERLGVAAVVVIDGGAGLSVLASN